MYCWLEVGDTKESKEEKLSIKNRMAKTPLKYWNADFWLRNLHNGRQF